jgi:hypothetical protein
LLNVQWDANEVRRPSELAFSKSPIGLDQARWVIDGKNLHVLCKIRLPPRKGIETSTEHDILTDAARGGSRQSILSEPAAHRQ